MAVKNERRKGVMGFKGTWVYQIGDEVSDSGWKQYFASECNQLRKRLMEMNKFGSTVFKGS